MAIEALDHVNLCTSQLPAMQRFYTETLGFEVGARPNFSFDGAWLYCGGRPTVHLVEVDAPRVTGTNLALQHFAFRGSDLSALLRQLQRGSIPYRVGFVRDFSLCQVHVHDPDGNQLHIDFLLNEAEALGLAPPA